MKKCITLFAAGAIALCLFAAAAHAKAGQAQPSTPPPPQAKHDSNTLHRWGRAIQYPFQKAGKAIQYPVRKAGENASVTAHTALGKRSVVHNRRTGQNELVSTTTRVTPMPNGPPKRSGRAPAYENIPANTQSDNYE